MARRNYSTTFKSIEKRIKEKRGMGAAEDYEAWIRTYEMSSLGRRARLLGWKTKREYHFLSDMERRYFFLSEWSEKVVDIREQYPLLPQEETMLIAERLGIKYPVDPKTKVPIVMSTDFVVTITKDNKFINLGRTIKPVAKLSNRTLEKFEIEKQYWALRNIDWCIVTEEQLPKVKTLNIAFIHPEYYLDSELQYNSLDKESFELIQEIFIKLFKETNATAAKIGKETDIELRLPIGTSLKVLIYMIARKKLLVNMDERIKFNVLKGKDFTLNLGGETRG